MTCFSTYDAGIFLTVSHNLLLYVYECGLKYVVHDVTYLWPHSYCFGWC